MVCRPVNMAVSYTHLDVYKRQLHVGINLHGFIHIDNLIKEVHRRQIFGIRIGGGEFAVGAFGYCFGAVGNRQSATGISINIRPARCV